MEGEQKNFYKKLISYSIFFNNKKCFPLHICNIFLPIPDACNLKFCSARARVACASYLLGHELEQLKTFLFDCFWPLPYIYEKNIYNMKKSLIGFEQITLVIMLYPGTKFELINLYMKN